MQVGVGKDLRMDPKVLLGFEVSQDQTGDPSDPRLNCGAVLDQYGNVFGYPFGDRAPLPENDLEQRFIMFHKILNLR